MLALVLEEILSVSRFWARALHWGYSGGEQWGLHREWNDTQLCPMQCPWFLPRERLQYTPTQTHWRNSRPTEPYRRSFGRGGKGQARNYFGSLERWFCVGKASFHRFCKWRSPGSAKCSSGMSGRVALLIWLTSRCLPAAYRTQLCNLAALRQLPLTTFCIDRVHSGECFMTNQHRSKRDLASVMVDAAVSERWFNLNWLEGSGAEYLVIFFTNSWMFGLCNDCRTEVQSEASAPASTLNRTWGCRTAKSSWLAAY